MIFAHSDNQLSINVAQRLLFTTADVCCIGVYFAIVFIVWSVCVWVLRIGPCFIAVCCPCFRRFSAAYSPDYIDKECLELCHLCEVSFTAVC